MIFKIPTIFLLSFLLLCFPVSAARTSEVIKNDEVGFQVEVPVDGLGNYAKIELTEEDVTKFEGGKDYFVSKVIDFYIADSNRQVVSLKPLRGIFMFDMIDFKRASKLNTKLSVGRFAIGIWKEGTKSWEVLPSQVFWDGTKGAVETEISYSGKYALLWSNKDTNLSPVGPQKMRIMINNTLVNSTVNPYVNAGTTMVPLRVVAQNLGLDVEWDEDERRIDLRKFPEEIKLWVGNTKAMVNKNEVILTRPAEIKGGSTFVPIRFVAEALGAEVQWDGVRKTVYIVKHGLGK